MQSPLRFPLATLIAAMVLLSIYFAGGVFARCLRASRRAALSAWVWWGALTLAVIPAGVIGLIKASDLATSFALSLLTSSLLLSVVCALSEESRLQVFALGFGLLGCMYFALQ